MVQLTRRRLPAVLAVTLAGLGVRRAAALPVPVTPVSGRSRVCPRCKELGRHIILFWFIDDPEPQPGCCQICGKLCASRRWF